MSYRPDTSRPKPCPHMKADQTCDACKGSRYCISPREYEMMPVAAPLPAAPAPTEQAAYHATIAASNERMKDPVKRWLAEQAEPSGNPGELPPLPAPFGSIDIYEDSGRVRSEDGFDATQMRGYAIDYANQLGRAALAARQGADHCAMCNDTGIVGRPPDDYFDCPDCVAARQAPQPKLTLSLPDYEARRIVTASDEVIDGERIVCVAIEGVAEQAGELPPLPSEKHHADTEWLGGGFGCPICGAESLHEHTGEEIVEYRNLKVKPEFWPKPGLCLNCNQPANQHVGSDGKHFCPVMQRAIYTADQMQDYARAALAARQAPTVPKLDYDLLKLTLGQTQERLRQADEFIAGQAPDSRDVWPEEPTPEMQAAGALAIRFDTTLINKMWTANAVYRAMRGAQEKAQ